MLKKVDKREINVSYMIQARIAQTHFDNLFVHV